ncbi:MAG: hydroxyisourate hydrolase [Pseudonocardiales bacterium]|nr:MAG: hydroxyisourate hydrolase [Pseudonocardiales bacterium]
MSISTHVLDAVTGQPAVGVEVILSRRDGRADTGWLELTRRGTDADGRVPDLAADPAAGVYRLSFDTDAYLGGDTFYPEVVVVFRVADASAHLHVPLLLSPFAYSTYRGS